MNEITQKVHWYVTIRWYYLSILAVTGIVPQLLNEGWSRRVAANLAGTASVIALNGLLMLAIRRRAALYSVPRIVIWHLGLDMLLAAYITLVQGAIESRTIILYTIPILLTGALLGRRATYVMAGLGAVLYAAVLTVDYFGIAENLVNHPSSGHDSPAYVINSVFFYTAVFFVIGWIAQYVLNLLERHQNTIVAQSAALAEAQRVARLGSWHWDISSGTIVWSDELFELYGLSPKKFDPGDQEAFFKLVHSDDRKLFNNLEERVTGTSEPLSFDFRFGRGQKVRHFRAHMRSSRKYRNLIVGITQDITESRKTEARARKRSRELEDLNRALIGRELKMVELKRRIKELENDKPKA